MKHFTSIGICLLGKGRNIHARDLPQGWAQWACDNVRGFREAFEAALTTHRPVQPPERPKRPPGRKYTLHSIKRRYQP